MADLIEHAHNREIVDQAYSLAVQCNKINEYLSRFDAVQIPQECQAVAGAQMAKLRAARQIIWNALLAIGSQGISMSDSSLKTFIEKQTDDSLALLEMEKLITAIKLDENQLWATDIAHMITSQPVRSHSSPCPPPNLPSQGSLTRSHPDSTRTSDSKSVRVPLEKPKMTEEVPLQSVPPRVIPHSDVETVHPTHPLSDIMSLLP